MCWRLNWLLLVRVMVYPLCASFQFKSALGAFILGLTYDPKQWPFKPMSLLCIMRVLSFIPLGRVLTEEVKNLDGMSLALEINTINVLLSRCNIWHVKLYVPNTFRRRAPIRLFCCLSYLFYFSFIIVYWISFIISHLWIKFKLILFLWVYKSIVIFEILSWWCKSIARASGIRTICVLLVQVRWKEKY